MRSNVMINLCSV